MKQLSLVAAFLILSIFSFAHTPVQTCSNDGFITYSWTNVPLHPNNGNDKNRVEISYDITGGGQYDTTIIVTALPFITKFSPSLAMNVIASVKFKFKDGFTTAIANVMYDPCALPITLDFFRGQINSSGLEFMWQTSMELNNNHFVIQKSINGVDWSDIATIESKAPNGISNTPLVYTYQIAGKVVSKAAMSSMLIVMAILSMVGLLMRLPKKIKVAIMVAFSMTLFSCNKTNLDKSGLDSIQKDSYYRLQQVDNDGHSSYSKIINL